MPTPRTTGMTAFGILNIVFGSLGSLMMVFVVLLGGLFAAGGAHLASDGTAEGQGVGGAIAAGGGMLMLIGLLSLACWGMMAMSGIGILKMAPWGPKFAMISCLGILAMQMITIFTSGFSFNIMTIATLGYCCACLYMCLTPQWKSAFGSQPHTGTPSVPNTSNSPSHGYDQYRDAA
jgi:hypothetical protein